MQRFFVSPEGTRGDTLVLSEREAHHALHVVRLRPGEVVEVLNGQGERLQCEAVGFSRRAVELRVTRREAVPARASPITLIQAVPKGKTFDTIVQKATELGVHRIVPLLTRRVVSQIDPKKNEAKLDHWRAIAMESIKQCGSPWLPLLDPPVALSELLPQLEPASLRLVASLRADARHPRTVLAGLPGSVAEAGQPLPRKSGAVQIWIGPEGDFTDDELDAIEASGAVPITLGPLVLRADTAAIYCLSVVSCALC